MVLKRVLFNIITIFAHLPTCHHVERQAITVWKSWRCTEHAFSFNLIQASKDIEYTCTRKKYQQSKKFNVIVCESHWKLSLPLLAWHNATTKGDVHKFFFHALHDRDVRGGIRRMWHFSTMWWWKIKLCSLPYTRTIVGSWSGKYFGTLRRREGGGGGHMEMSWWHHLWKKLWTVAKSTPF